MRVSELYSPDNAKLGIVGLGIGFIHPGWLPSHQQGGASSVVLALLERTFQWGQPYSPRAMRFYAYYIDSVVTRRTAPGSAIPDDHRTWARDQRRAIDLVPAAEDYLTGAGLGPEDLEIGIFDKSEFVLGNQMAPVPVQWVANDGDPSRAQYTLGFSLKKNRMKNRGIYTPKDKAHVATGRWAKATAKCFKIMRGVETNLFYAGASGPDIMNLWLQRLVPKWDTHWTIMTDVSRCETNKCGAVVDARMRYYRHTWAYHDADRDRVMAAWKRARFRARCGNTRISGVLPPNMTLSGEDWTSLDNSLDISVMLEIAVACCLEHRTPHSLGPHDAGWVESVWAEDVMAGCSGDDGLILIPRSWRGSPVDPNTFCRDMKTAAIQLGFLLTARVSETFADSVFLGNRPYHCEDGFYRWGRLIGRACYKHHCARKLESDPYDWLHQVAEAEPVS